MDTNRLKRQRRRYTYTGVAAMLAGLIAFGPSAAALCGLIGLGTLSLALLVQPALRNWAETLSTGMLLAAALPILPEMMASVGLIIGWLVHQLAYGRWMEVFGFGFRVSSLQRRQISATPEQIWTSVVPGEAHPEDYHTGTLLDFNHDRDDPGTIYLRMMAGDQLPEEMMLTHLERKPFKRSRFMIERDEDKHEATVIDITLHPVEERLTHVTLKTELADARLSSALMRWFDSDLTINLKEVDKAASAHSDAFPAKAKPAF